MDKVAVFGNALTRWGNDDQGITALFSRQALPMAWDFAESAPLRTESWGWSWALDWITEFYVSQPQFEEAIGEVVPASAAEILLPDDSVQAIVTDPPYYDAIAYGDLSNFFYVWLKRTLFDVHKSLFSGELVDTTDEIVQLSKRYSGRYSHKTKEYFENEMKAALMDCRRVLIPDGLEVIVFANSSTSGWEAMLKAMLDAGWIITASWPIDTEMKNRMNAIGTASLNSSIHLVCRPREHPSGEVREDDVGDWREVLSELPQRIHAWLPRLAQEGVVGADAIFSCLGPALEIYSRYSRVEKASGEQVALSEYLQEVWAAVSREALGTIFSGDTGSFEEDARLTAMWLWTLTAGDNGNVNGKNKKDEVEEEDEEAPSRSKLSGFILEFDAARKIAQGLGVSLENLPGLVEIKGDKVRLLLVSERASYLLGQEVMPAKKRKKDKTTQMTFAGDEATAEIIGSPAVEKSFSPGPTTLDRVHQAMLLFGQGRGEGLKSFLQEIGQDQGFWSLAQALNSLYPVGSEERRWVEGVLARKKSMGI